MDRGFDGTTWTRAEFTAHLNSITLPARIQAVCIHCVAVPMKLFYTTTKSEDPDVDAAQRMRNMFTDVRDRLKGVAYHAVSFPHGQIGKATDMRVQGNHASSWNDETLGIEMFFEKWPLYRRQFTFVQIGAPSRTVIPRYHDLMAEVEAEAERLLKETGSVA